MFSLLKNWWAACLPNKFIEWRAGGGNYKNMTRDQKYPCIVSHGDFFIANQRVCWGICQVSCGWKWARLPGGVSDLFLFFQRVKQTAWFRAFKTFLSLPFNSLTLMNLGVNLCVYLHVFLWAFQICGLIFLTQTWVFGLFVVDIPSVNVILSIKI